MRKGSLLERRIGVVLGGMLVVGWIVFFTSGTWHGRRGAGGAPADFGQAAPATATAALAGAAVPSSSSGLSPARGAAQMTVYVTGAVKHPGLYKLPLDARMVAAVEAAGGALPSADLGAVDLAAVVEDGMQIVIPDRLRTNGTGGASAFSVPQANGGAASDTRPARRKHKLPPGARIDINRANLADLEELPGIGPKKAQAILRFRQQRRLFTTLQELGQVPGIGPRLLSRFLPFVSLSGP
jgi:competence protein ComEA